MPLHQRGFPLDNRDRNTETTHHVVQAGMLDGLQGR